MNKSELIAKIAEQTGVTKKVATSVVEAFQNVVTEELSHGGKVQLIGFGNFETRKRAARKGRNPQTGAEMEIAASVVPAFKAGKKLKDAVRA
jgi:DNA-binding protein HU-beta